MSRLSATFALALAAASGACASSSPSDEQERPGPDSPAETRDWTVMIYGHGDHNLSATLLRDVQEMAAARIDPEKVNLIAVLDFDSSQVNPATNRRFPSGYAVVRVPGSGEELIEVGGGEELDLDDPENISQLTQEVFEAFPSRKRGMVLWDHGGAWSLGFGGDRQDGTRRSARGIGVVELAEAVKHGLDGAGISAQPPLDFFAFDTCLMAGAEVVSEFAELSSVYIADAEIDYGEGWDYKASFEWLSANSRADAKEFGVAEVDAWDAHHANASVSDQFTRSHIALDMTAWSEVVSADDALAKEPAVPFESVARSGYFSLPSYSNTGVISSGEENLRDIGSFARRLATAGSAQATRLLNALQSATLNSSQGSLRAADNHIGIHVELPAARAFKDVAERYRRLAPTWNQQSSWSVLLEGVAAAADDTGPVLEQTPGTPGSRTVEFGTTDSDAADALVLLATPIDDYFAFVGTVGYAPIEAGATYEATWDGNVLVAGPRGAQALVSVLPGLTGGDAETPPIFMMPMYWAEEEAMLGFLFGPDDQVARYAVLLDTQPAVLSTEELVEVAGNVVLNPIFVGIDRTTGEGSSLIGRGEVRLAAEGIQLERVQDGEDQFFAATLLTDVWGNQSADVDEIQPPAGTE